MSFADIIRGSMVPFCPIETGMHSRGAPVSPVRAALFDVYGTLFMSGSGDIFVTASGMSGERMCVLEGLLRRYGVEDEASEVFKRYLGEIDRTHERLRGEGCDYPEVEIEKVWMKVLELDDPFRAREFSVEYECLFNPVWPMPYLREMLDRLSARGVLLGIISNAQFFTPLLFEASLGVQPEDAGFDEELLFYSFRFGRAKPSPLLYERAREHLECRGIAASNTLYSGNDMLNDILPAMRAGFQTALFAGDGRSLRLRGEDPRCSGEGPDMVVTDLQELTDLIIKGRRDAEWETS